jgi:hypothetical protein
MGEARRKRLLGKAMDHAKKLEEIQQPDYRPGKDPEFRAGIAVMIRAVEFPDAKGGQCLLRCLVALEMMRGFDLNPSLHIGSLLYRVGPDPYRDVVAFCGRGNAGFSVDGHGNSFHAWIGVGGDIADFAVGDWYDSARNHDYSQEEALFPRAPKLGPIQWTIAKPPNYWWRPRAELVKPWRSEGSPELGAAWYGPFNGNAMQMTDRIKQIWIDDGPTIAAAVRTVQNRAAQRMGMEFSPSPSGLFDFPVIVETASVPTGYQQVMLSEIWQIAGIPWPSDLQDVVSYVERMPSTREQAIALLRNMTVTVPPGCD